MENPIVSSLLHHLGLHVGTREYQPVTSQNQLRRETDGGFQCLVVAAGSTVPTLAELHLGIRIDVVEKLVYQFTNGLTSYGAHSTTLIGSAGRIRGLSYLRYELNEVAESLTVAQQMNEFLMAEGFTFLQKFQRIEALDALYNAEPLQKSLLLPNLLHRSLRGVVLAKLAQRDDWLQLAETYRTQLIQAGTPGAMIQRYVLLAKYLRNFSIN